MFHHRVRPARHRSEWWPGMARNTWPASPEYADRLPAAQGRLRSLAWRAHKAGINTVCVFEGWDAAGKGGAIRRITGAISPQKIGVIGIAGTNTNKPSTRWSRVRVQITRPGPWSRPTISGPHAYRSSRPFATASKRRLNSCDTPVGNSMQFLEFKLS